jgi:8-oxo-dGTP pyrophosphatase MutT (NUDIX family)
MGVKMRAWNPRDILGCYGLYGKEFAQIAWGHVSKNDSDLLVVERHKEDDPERHGQLVLPGGRVDRLDETDVFGAQRETIQETGVLTKPGCSLWLTNLHDTTVVKESEKGLGIVEPNGRIWYEYRDSGKLYTGRVFDLVPLSDPKQTEDVNKRPRYIPIEDALWGSQYENFTPLCQLIMEMLKTELYGITFPEKENLLLAPHDLTNYLKMAPTIW